MKEYPKIVKKGKEQKLVKSVEEEAAYLGASVNDVRKASEAEMKAAEITALTISALSIVKQRQEELDEAIEKEVIANAAVKLARKKLDEAEAYATEQTKKQAETKAEEAKTAKIVAKKISGDK